MSPILIVFIAFVIIQMGFIIILGSRLLSVKSRKTDKTPGVSVIIAARNEAQNLPELLSRLANQDYPDFEVIISNDRSEDHSTEILEQFRKQYTWLKTIPIQKLPESWTGKKYAIHQAVSKAEKDILLFTDADCIPSSSQWIRTMASGFNEDTDIILGYSPYHRKSGWLNLFIQFETLWVAMQYLGFSLLGKTYMGVGRNMAIRRDCYDLNYLEKIRALEGGDDDLMIAHLARKNNVKVEIRKETFTYSQPKTSLKTYLKQKIRHLAAGKHYHKKDQTLLAIFTLSCVFMWGLLAFLLLAGKNLTALLMVFGVRSLVVYPILHRLGRKLNTDIDFWALPFLDLCYCFYYPWVAIKALATKQVEWK